MSRFSRTDVINAIYERGLVPSFLATNLDEAREAVKACADGGARVILCRMADATNIQIFRSLIEELADTDPLVILGAGPVADAQMAEELLNSGAGFLIGKTGDPEIARSCHRRKVNFIPVCRNQTDIDAAEEMGIETVRVHHFEPELTPTMLSDILRKRPWTRIMVAGDIRPDQQQLASWVKAGAACIGMDVRALVDPDSLAGITAQIANSIWFVKEARGENLFCGVEHLGIYPKSGQAASELTDWYNSMFGFKVDEGESWYFVHSTGPGRIEILKDHEPTKAHAAIKVRHFDLACRVLAKKGIEFEPVKDFGRVKAVFLKQLDPAGHKVHLLYQALL